MVYNIRYEKRGCGHMNCMKCGKETTQSQVFCDRCLEVMAQYPVDPATAFQLPQRKDLPADKKALRVKELSPKEALRRQRKLTRRLRIALLAACALVVLLLVTLILVLYTQTEFFSFLPFLP